MTGAMNDPYMARLAEDWIATFGRSDHLSSDQGKNPFTALQAIIKGDPLYAWGLIVKIVEMDKNGLSLELLAAGPLEDFLILHGDSMIDYIEEDIRENYRIQSVLGGVRKSVINDLVWDRLQQMRSAG